MVRGCGYISDARDNGMCTRRTGTHDVIAHYCACTSDLCNGATEKLPSFVTIGIVPILLLLFKI